MELKLTLFGDITAEHSSHQPPVCGDGGVNISSCAASRTVGPLLEPTGMMHHSCVYMFPVINISCTLMIILVTNSDSTHYTGYLSVLTHKNLIYPGKGELNFLVLVSQPTSRQVEVSSAQSAKEDFVLMGHHTFPWLKLQESGTGIDKTGERWVKRPKVNKEVESKAISFSMVTLSHLYRKYIVTTTLQFVLYSVTAFLMCMSNSLITQSV